MRNPSDPVVRPKEAPKPVSSQDQMRAFDESALKNAKRLNVLFLYNGHDWDAYQVLGLPAGASLSMVTERYQQLVKESHDKGQIEFYQAAYSAILKKV